MFRGILPRRLFGAALAAATLFVTPMCLYLVCTPPAAPRLPSARIAVHHVTRLDGTATQTLPSSSAPAKAEALAAATKAKPWAAEHMQSPGADRHRATDPGVATAGIAATALGTAGVAISRPDPTLWRGVAFMGMDVGHQTAAAVEQCVEQCKAAPRCKALSFNKKTEGRAGEADAAESAGGICWMKSARPTGDRTVVAWVSTTSWDGTPAPRRRAPQRAAPQQRLAVLIPSFPRHGIENQLLQARLQEVCSAFRGHQISVYVYTDSPATKDIAGFDCGVARAVQALNQSAGSSRRHQNENIGRHFVDALSHVEWGESAPGYVLWLEDDVELASTAFLPAAGEGTTAVWSMADADGFTYHGVGAWGLLYAPGNWLRMFQCMRDPLLNFGPDWKTNRCCKRLQKTCLGFGPHTAHRGAGKSTYLHKS